MGCCGSLGSSDAESREAKVARKRRGSIIGTSKISGTIIGPITGEIFGSVVAGSRLMISRADSDQLVKDGMISVESLE